MYFLDQTFLGFVVLWLCLYWLAGRARNWLLLLGSVGWLLLFSPQTLVALTALTVGVIYPVTTRAAHLRTGGLVANARFVAWFGCVTLILITIALRLKTQLLSVLDSSIEGEFLQWVGFSYFLLKGIHVMFAVSRGITPPPGLFTLVQYVLFIPTLTSGPLYRVGVFGDQLAAPKTLNWDIVQDGVLRVVRGIAKKVIAVPLFVAVVHQLSRRGPAWQPVTYTVAYVMLFLDFSGYSDIGIGLGRLFGFEVPENFKNPFTVTTLTQFWRNWHATLGDWLRENIFIPLGGMRARGWHMTAITVATMLFVGAWHAFDWVFIAWGAYNAVLLLLENWVGVKPMRPYKTPWWRLGVRYLLVQLAAIGGMFAFVRSL